MMDCTNHSNKQRKLQLKAVKPVTTKKKSKPFEMAKKSRILNSAFFISI
jgi:hypothetical protein